MEGHKGAPIHSNPYNEVNSKDPDKPDSNGMDLYYGGYDEVIKMTGKSTGPMVSTPNSDMSHDVYGGPAKGEPNPIGKGGKG